VVAERDGTMVGAALLGADGKIALCYLVPEARFLGLGKSMLGALEHEARKRGQTNIELSSTKTGHEFYRRNGYVDTGKVESAFGFSVAVMRKEIRAPERA
jgi:GNAT superfamily N-acetyltransferase